MRWPAYLDIDAIAGARGELTVPGSKSISIRALLLAAFSEGTTRLTGLLDSDDCSVMQAALHACGVKMHSVSQGVIEVHGARELALRDADIFLGNSGLSARTLLAALAFAGGRFRLAGVPRMHERPIADLVDSLRALGARIRYLGKEGFPPLLIEPALARGARDFTVRGDASSQFLTGLLQAAPQLANSGPVTIRVEGALISRPYVALTLAMMRWFGVEVRGDADAPQPTFVVPQGAAYRSPGVFAIEGDASSASYFLALGALAGGPIRVRGVARESLQADASFAGILEIMGASVTSGPDWIEAGSPGIASGFRLRAIDADLNRMPDAAMTVALLALFADGASTLRNIGSWRVKETDRIAAMASELAKLGARVTAGADFLCIEPPSVLRSARIATYDDHRMAMSFALAACGGVAQRIEDPGCVAKTYPGFFDDLVRLAGAGVVHL